MINFRYHIVSLMAVFLALSVGIAVGVTLGSSVDQGLTDAAVQDRKQVQDLRVELDRRQVLDEYRDAYATRAGAILTEAVLADERVALVVMPDAPNAVVDTLAAAITQSGGTLTRTVTINTSAFDPSKAADHQAAIDDKFGQDLGFIASMSRATKLGLAVGRSLLSKTTAERDTLASDITTSLTDARMVSVNDDSTAQAQLVIVVTAEAIEPRPAPEQVAAHVETDIALSTFAAGVVVAGPNSDNIDGTDVLQVRINAVSANLLSTVDVADLSSGVTTVILAGKEQLLGRQGRHYGALTRADAPAPELPVR